MRLVPYLYPLEGRLWLVMQLTSCSMQHPVAGVLALQHGRTKFALTSSLGAAALCSGAVGHNNTPWDLPPTQAPEI